MVVLRRDEFLSRYEGWRAFAEADLHEPPEHRTLSEIQSLTDGTRDDYNERRRQYHSTFLVRTPQVKRILTSLWDVLDANMQGPDRVKGAAVIDAPPALGKSTVANAFGREFHLQQIQRHGALLDDGSTFHLPVCRVGFNGNMTTRALNEAILNFYAHPAADSAKNRSLRNRNLATVAADCVRRHGTRLIIVDDVHFLRVKGKAAMSQTARRWTLLTLEPFEPPPRDGGKTWGSLLATIESKLVLANAREGMLRAESDYLFTRSSGMIGSLFELIIRGAARAIRTGEENLSRELLDSIQIDAAAEDRRATLGADLAVMRSARK